MNRGTVLVVTGPPAAGKTTVARTLATDRTPSVHLHADDFWAFLTTGYVEPWLPAARQQNDVVIRAICDATRAFADGGYHVVLDGVIGPWFLEELLSRCPPEEISIDYVMLLPQLTVLLDRLGKRTGHGFTSAEAAEHMYQEFIDARAGHERHVIDTSELTSASTLHAVRAARDIGQLRLTPDDAPGR